MRAVTPSSWTTSAGSFATKPVTNCAPANDVITCELMLDEQQLARFHDQGFLIIEGFATESECDELRARAEELVQAFDPDEVVSIFSTREL